jgi:D-tyrosyl-tRNA(Tyr) deacylase
MIALIQRVSQAEVRSGERSLGRIDQGIVALVGVKKSDDEASAERLLTRLLAFRIFPDAAGRMNLDLPAIGGGLLLIPQFTLVADTAHGNRPGFSTAAPAGLAQSLFDHLVAKARERHPAVATGLFGAHMLVSLINDGPVTFWLET